MSYIKKIKILFIPMFGLEFNFRPFVHMEWAGKAETNERISIFDFEREKSEFISVSDHSSFYIYFRFWEEKNEFISVSDHSGFQQDSSLTVFISILRICLCFQNFWKKFNLHFPFPKTHPKTNNSLIFLLSHLLSST